MALQGDADAGDRWVVGDDAAQAGDRRCRRSARSGGSVSALGQHGELGRRSPAGLVDRWHRLRGVARRRRCERGRGEGRGDRCRWCGAFGDRCAGQSRGERHHGAQSHGGAGRVGGGSGHGGIAGDHQRHQPSRHRGQRHQRRDGPRPVGAVRTRPAASRPDRCRPRLPPAPDGVALQERPNSEPAPSTGSACWYSRRHCNSASGWATMRWSTPSPCGLRPKWRSVRADHASHQGGSGHELDPSKASVKNDSGSR